MAIAVCALAGMVIVLILGHDATLERTPSAGVEQPSRARG
jgi:hypothetical protein